MQTKEQIKAATIAEFINDATKQIIDSEVKEGCVMELEAAPVFEALAKIRGESVRSLGNDYNWNLSGLEAAELMAEERCMENEVVA